MTKSAGLSFKKFDLHVHTPASHDFVDKTIKPSDIVDEAIKKNLSAIAITDHNTGEWIDQVILASKSKNLTVFPGVEIYCTGGEKGIHVIAILDVDKGTKHISGILSSLKIDPDDFGKRSTVTHKSVYEVIEVITSKPYFGIAVLAHCTSSKGVLSEIKGETRTEIFKHPNLLAVETSQHDFTDANKIKKRTRAIDLLDGEDENFHYRKLGVYISSDSHESGIEGHTLKGLGSQFTHFKVDDEINLESLRQCFIDRDVRIRQSFEYSTNVYPTINKIEIKGGFFDNQNAYFHKGLNSILGSKGAGKSLLVELLRFGLNKASSQADIYKDHISKLEKRLQTYGKVLIELIDDTGMTHLLERTFNPTENNPYNSSEQESIANSFNTIFLSQNEIIKIAEDESEQINFIDSFFDFQYFKNKINNTEKDISIFDDILADGLKAFSDVFEVQAQINIFNKEKQKLDKILSDKVYDSFKSHEEKDNAFTNQENFIDEIISELELKLDEYRKKTAPDYSKTNLSADPAIKRNTDTLNDALNEYRNKLSESLETIKQLQNKISEERKPWNKTFKEVKSKYEAHIRTTGGDRKTQEAKRIRIINELNELNKRLTALNKKKENIKNTIAERNKKIDELFSIYKKYSNERKAKCQKFEEQSNGKLKIQIKESTNFDDFKNSLLQLKKGSYIQNADIDAICSNITPKEFIECLFNYEVSKKAQNLNPISEQTGISLEKIKILCDFLLSQVDYSNLLKLQYKAKPQDRPEIRYRVNESDYEIIKNISVGQKCTAMLIMTLSEGMFPIIIDQPEDSLDVRSIWEDMCLKVREGKENRQFVFTTHNSSLAVASDTDKFTIIESDSETGKVVFSGALESTSIKEEVITYLEGGRKTYTHKAKKYDI